VRVLLFAATTGYQIRAFDDAARRIGAELRLATDRCHVLDDPWGDRAIPVKFERIEESLEVLRGVQADGIVAVGDQPAVLAAEAAAMLGVPFHPPAAARACHDKFLAREIYRAAGLRTPAYFRAQSVDDGGRALYPCVLKPLRLSASRGVIRADNPDEFRAAFRRIERMGEHAIQVESYIPGREFAIEGLVTRGNFQVLAIFDKPDPLEGPFFEETIYVTPSREGAAVQEALIETAAAGVRAVGLWQGPVHVELRGGTEVPRGLKPAPHLLEVHARPIGGLCARALRFDGGMGLEELILRHALGEDVAVIRREAAASGVMMIPIPKDGIYQSVDGIERVRAVPGIEDVVVTAKEGQRLVPLPEGASYLGFIFARGGSPAEVERALRRSHAELEFRIATVLETFKPSL
jgi:biotin carboxylase